MRHIYKVYVRKNWVINKGNGSEKEENYTDTYGHTRVTFRNIYNRRIKLFLLNHCICYNSSRKNCRSQEYQGISHDSCQV